MGKITRDGPVATRLDAVLRQIRDAEQEFNRPPGSVSLLAVSKTKPVEMIRACLDQGQQAFGENNLQDALPKIEALRELHPQWHYIGTIQSNKTRAIAENFDWVHSLASLSHARRLSQQRPAQQAPLNVCIQVNLDAEQSKGGVSVEQVPELASAVSELTGLRLRGLMALPAPSEDFERQRAGFARLARLQTELNLPGLDTLSMGMSNDLRAAIAEGSTLVRVGTAIFGARESRTA